MSGQFLTNGRWADYPQGYVFNTEIYCPGCIREMFESNLHNDPGESYGPEETLELVAEMRGIDYSDEYSYDSDEFPKIIQDSEGEHCASCMLPLEEV
jgi:hypothetical protein